MKKNVLTPLILLLVLLGLAGLAYWDEKKSATDKTAEEAKGKLFSVAQGDIVEIAITNVTAEPKSWKLIRDQGASTWKVASPLPYPADGEGIERLIKIILDTKSEREFDMGSRSLANFGLEPAQIIYELKDKSGKSHKLSIGGKSPTGYASYAQKGDDPKVLLVNQIIFTATNKTMTDFRDRKIGVPPIGDITKIFVSFSGQPEIQVEKREKDWRVTQPIQLKADAQDMTRWLSSWESLRASDFIDSPTPDLRKALTVTGKGTQELAKVRFETSALSKEFRIVLNNDKVYSQLSETTFVELDRPSVESLRKTAKEFEDRSVFTFVSADVTKVAIDGVNYVKDKNEWVSEKDKKPMPFVQGMVLSLEFAKADSKLNAKEAEASLKAAAVHTVEIYEGQKPPVQFSVWKKVGGESPEGMFVLKTGENYFQVNAEFLETFKPKSQI